MSQSNIDYIYEYMSNTNIWIQHINGIAGRFVDLCTKVVWLTALFLNSKHLFI